MRRQSAWAYIIVIGDAVFLLVWDKIAIVDFAEGSAKFNMAAIEGKAHRAASNKSK